VRDGVRRGGERAEVAAARAESQAIDVNGARVKLVSGRAKERDG
jgi:hypothetical protein